VRRWRGRLRGRLASRRTRAAGAGERTYPSHEEEASSPRLGRSSAVRRPDFESGATGSLERHWHAVGLQVVRVDVRPAGAADSSVPVRGSAGTDEEQHPVLQVSGRPAQQAARAAEPQSRPPTTPASAMPAVATNAPQIAARAIHEERRWRREPDIIRPFGDPNPEGQTATHRRVFGPSSTLFDCRPAFLSDKLDKLANRHHRGRPGHRRPRVAEDVRVRSHPDTPSPGRPRNRSNAGA
jgi:hypothetical protein